MSLRMVTLSAVVQSGRAVESAAKVAAEDSPSLSARIAEALQYLGPFPLYACLLHTADASSLTALDETGSPRADWESELTTLLRRWAQSQGDELLTPSASIGVAGEWVCGAAVVFQGRRYGALALGADRNIAEEVVAGLSLVADRLAVQLYFAEHGAAAELERVEWLNNIAETTSIVSHEFNNFLNGMMLHLALLKQEAPKGMSAALDTMKRLATDAATMVKKLQEHNGRRRPCLVPTNLNDSVREALERTPLPEGVIGVNYDLAEELPPVSAARLELGRLLGLLLRQAGAAMRGKPGLITLRTQPTGRKVVLRFEDAGPCLEGEAFARVFEPFYLARPGAEEPGLALCHTLARRLHATLRAENRTEGGVAFILEFTPATNPV